MRLSLDLGLGSVALNQGGGVPALGIDAAFLGTQISDVTATDLPNIGFIRVCSGGGQLVGWQDFDTDGNPANFNATAIGRLDAYADFCRGRGIKLHYVFDATPAYCATGGDTHNISTSATPLNTFLDWLVDRVGDVLGSIEPWNEPNTPGSFTGTEAGLVTHATRIFDWVQINAPGLLVTTPSFTDGSAVAAMQSYLEAGGNDACDVFSYHAYAGGADDVPLSYNPEAAADYAELHQLICPEKPLWMTEVGDSSPSIAKMVAIVQSLARMGHDKVVLYSWQDAGIGNMRLDALGQSAWNSMYSRMQQTEAPLFAPVNLREPIDTSDGVTIETTNGVWSASRPLSFAYQRRRNGVNIDGATTQDYTIVAEDAAKTLTAQVTATNDAGSASAISSGAVVAGFWPSGADAMWDFPSDQYMLDGDVIAQAAAVQTTRAGTVTVKDSANNDVVFTADQPAITDVGLYTTANDILRGPVAVGATGIGGRVRINAASLVSGGRAFELSDATSANRWFVQLGGGNWVLTCVTASGVVVNQFVAAASTGVQDFAFAFSSTFARVRLLGSSYGDFASTSQAFPAGMSQIGFGGNGRDASENGDLITTKVALMRGAMDQTVMNAIEAWSL